MRDKIEELLVTHSMDQLSAAQGRGRGGGGGKGREGKLLPFVFLSNSGPVLGHQLQGISIIQEAEYLLQEFLLQKPTGDGKRRERGSGRTECRVR
jgi:hypothetical protein